MNAIANTNSETRGIRPVNQRSEIVDAAFYTCVAASIASRINVSGTLMQHCREAIDTVNKKTIVWEKSLHPIEVSIKYRKSTEYYHPKDPRRDKQLLREREKFRTLWKMENRKKSEEPISGREESHWRNESQNKIARKKMKKNDSTEKKEGEANWREKSRKEMQEIKENTKMKEKEDDECKCLGVPTKTPVTIITLDDENDDTTKLSNIERTNRKRGYEEDFDEGEKTTDIDSRSLASLDHQKDSIAAGKRSLETTDECVPPKAKRAKNDTESTSTITEAPELLDERVGNAAFLVRIPRTAITLNLNSYMSVSSKKNLSPPRNSPEIRVADSSVPDVSPVLDKNHNTSKKCDSNIVGKKPKIIEDVTCIEGTILTTAALKQNGKDSEISSEKSLKDSTIPKKKFTDKSKFKDISVGKITKNSAGAERQKKSSRKVTKNLISPTKHERIQEKFRTLFGNEATLTESDEECKLISKCESRKRRKESRMSLDSGVCMTELASDSMMPEHDKLEDEITFQRDEQSTICDDQLVKSMPSLDCTSVEIKNPIIKPRKALPDSSTSLEEKSSIRPDSSSYDKIMIPVAPLNTDDSGVCGPLQSVVGLPNETQISTPTSTTACLPIGTSTKIDPIFEDLQMLIDMDLKNGCRIDMQGNRISIQENAALIDEDTTSCYNDDENPLVIDEGSCSDDFGKVQSLRHNESSKDDSQRIDVSVNFSNIKEMLSKTELHRDLFVPQSSNADEIILPNTLDDDLASKTIEKTSTSSNEKIPSKLPKSIESYKDDGSIDENQNSTNLKVTNSGTKTYKETSILNVIFSTNLPALSSADKAVDNILPETVSNTGLNDNTNIEIDVDKLYEKLTSDIARIDSASEHECKNENPNKNINNESVESKPINSIIDETKDSRPMIEVLPDSELPIFLVEPQKAKEIPKTSTFRVLHPTELGARWCPTPLNANVPNQSQLQYSSNPSVAPSISNLYGTQTSSNALMAQSSSNALMAQSSSNALMLQSSSYQFNNTNQLPLPTTHQIQHPSCQYNPMQQVSMPTIVEASQRPLYPSTAQIAQTLPTASTRALQPPPYPSIPQDRPQRPPVVMMRAPAPTSLDHLQHIVNTTLPPTQGAQDLSTKISTINRHPNRRPPPNHTGIAPANNHYTRPTVNFRQQPSATSVLPNSYQINNGPSIVDLQLVRICDLLLRMSFYQEGVEKEYDMYKISEQLTHYNNKLQLLIPELETYARTIGTRDRQTIVKSIVRFYEERIEPGHRMLNVEKVSNILNKAQMMQTTIRPQTSVQPLLTELQWQTLRNQITHYKRISHILHYQLLAQNEMVERERLKKLEAAKAKRTRRKRTTAVQDHSNVQPVHVALPTIERLNYQQTIENTIERILREDTIRSNNVPANVNEGIVNGNNIRVNSNHETVREQSIDNTVAENLREIYRQHPVSKNPQDNNIECSVRNKTTENNIQDKTMESNLRNKTIETTVHDKTVESNTRDEVIGTTGQDKIVESNTQDKVVETTVQNKIVESNIRDKIIETNVQDNLQSNITDNVSVSNLRNQGYDKVIPSNIHVQIFEKEKRAPIKSVSERSFASIKDGNTSVLDVLIEFDVLDSIPKGRGSKISKCRNNVGATALVESKKCSKDPELTCPEVSPVPVLNPAPSTDNSDSPKTETLKDVTLGSKPTESVEANCGSSAIVSPVEEEVVEKNAESSTKVPEISESVETKDGSMDGIPVITLDDEDDLDAGSKDRTSIEDNADIIEIDSFNILEVKSISKDVFNKMGDMIDKTASVDRTSNKVANDNDTANECADSKNEGNNCFNCGEEITLACERCRSAFYCSTKCHQEHWSVSHHLECKLASEES